MNAETIMGLVIVSLVALVMLSIGIRVWKRNTEYLEKRRETTWQK